MCAVINTHANIITSFNSLNRNGLHLLQLHGCSGRLSAGMKCMRCSPERPRWEEGMWGTRLSLRPAPATLPVRRRRPEPKLYGRAAHSLGLGRPRTT